jgi:hypothetical protein
MQETNLILMPQALKLAWDPTSLAGSASLSNNNTRVTIPTTSTSNAVNGNKAKSIGQWYFELLMTTLQRAIYGGPIGVTGVRWFTSTASPQSQLIITGQSTRVNYSTRFATGTNIGVALDCDNRTLQFYKQGVAQGIINLNSYPGVGTVFVPAINGATQTGGASSVTDILSDADLQFPVPDGFLPW